MPLLAALAMSVCAAVLVGPPVRAAPTAPLFTEDIDKYADYDGQDTCSPTAKPGASALLNMLTAEYPGTYGYIVRDCAIGGQSEHKEGRAVDWMISAATEHDKADDLFEWLFRTDAFGNSDAMVRRLGIMYIIWDREIWRAYDAGEGWQPYTGASPHTDHVHISMSWDGADQETTWYTGSEEGLRFDQARFGASWRTDKQLDVFRRSKTGTLEQRTWNGAAWTGWQDLGGDIKSAPAAVWSGKKKLWVFAAGEDGYLHKRRWKVGRGWRPWQITSDKITAAPGVTGGDGRLDLVVRTSDGSVNHRYWSNKDGWEPWEKLGGYVTSPPTAVWSAADRFDVFARGSNGQLYRMAWRAGVGWDSWKSLGGLLLSGPSATAYTPGEASVFVRTSAASISYLKGLDTWSTWQDLGGEHESGPAATGITDVRTDVFTRHPGGGLYQDSYGAGTGWTGWYVR